MKVSFDFDGSLDRESLQKYAKELVDLGYEVHIVTRRFETLAQYTDEFCIQYKINDLSNAHQYLFNVADEIGIPRDRIHFTNMKDKFIFFNDSPGFLWHLDDDWLEIRDINKHTDVIGISCVGSNWKHKCNKLLNNEIKQ